MSVELWSTANTVPFLRGGSPLVRYETIIQIGLHVGDLVAGTVLGRIGSSRKWQPVTPGNTDGTQFPNGVLLRTISEAQIQAGDVDDVPIMTGGQAVVLAASGLTIEAPATLDTVVANPTNLNMTIRDLMAWANMYVIDDQNIERAQEPPPAP
jgi:hypothetical protein